MRSSAARPRADLSFRRQLAALLVGPLAIALASCDGGTEPRVPSALEKLDGDVQVATVNTALATAPSVRVRDQDGDPLSGVLVSFAVLEGSGSIAAGSAVTDQGGVASPGAWTLGTRAGRNALSASVAGAGSVEFTATGAPGAPAQVAVTAGGAQQARVAEPVLTPPSVRVTDAFGNPTPAVEVTFQIASGAGEVDGPQQRTDAQGIATVGAWRLGQTAGENRLMASAAGGATTIITANATAGRPEVLFRFTGDGGAAQVATALQQPPVVKVADTFGNPVAGVPVSFSVSQGGGSVDPPGAVTNSEGLAGVTRWTLGTAAGVNTLTASAEGVPPITFNATGTAASPAAVAAVAGQNQSAPAGGTVAVRPAARVTDSYGNPVLGATVTFVVTSGGGSVSGAVQQTNAYGVATVTAWTLGPSAGPNVLEARAAGGVVARFDATATPSSGGGGGGNGVYDVSLRFGSGLTPSQQAIFQQAVARWQSIITADLASVQISIAANECGSNPAFSETVDDLVIFASAVSIDGVSGVLGRAGPCFVRNSNLLPVVGFMEFDAADMAALEATGDLLPVILHEIGHVLGIGTIWELKELLSGKGTTHPTFTGARAIESFDAVGGSTYMGGKVPVEASGGAGTRDSHWRENLMGTELMTGYMNGGVANPLSIVTISSLRDLGYQVDSSRADPYTLNAGLLAAPGASGERLELIEQLAPAPILVGPDGRIQRPPERR